MQKVLIITYYWPPAGGPGVQRWLKFVKYLRDFNIEPVVYVPENPHYPLIDKSFENEIPSDITVIKKPIKEPYQLAGVFSKKESKTISSGIIKDEKEQGLLQKMMLWVRGNLFIPDARMFWVKPSVKFLLSYLNEHQIETVITTGPPHSLHLIGKQLKEKLAVNWIADFRDPWTKIGYHHKLKLTKASQKKHLKLEKEVLQTADHLLTTSFTTKKDFSAITKQPISVITNGYDDDEIEQVKLAEKFRISHIGSLLSERNPKHLWQALRELTQENQEFKKDFELVLAGKVSETVINSIKANGLENCLIEKGYLSHEESLIQQRKAQVLLLIEIDKEETQGIIPGKFFEYLKASRPILAIGPKNWDVIRLIEETQAGSYFGYLAKKEIKHQIYSWYQLYKQGKLLSEVSTEKMDQFHRKNLTRKLASVIQQFN
ncbi:glycosyltransferase family 4 protein [Mesonia aestuariivivens]|uniref:Glycosyltransferase family 4 protein n=1 Tax=Mesonia aestuariivivens TaxID=2796128 RepID=A0ABS6VZH8_9FLAO|nr:glycosyltransferase family 4 protein [Mesonia aestuariivivens]MBW2960671.1 glycosyltransferase family 4 protein [Mesonia aestuariivivens]